MKSNLVNLHPSKAVVSNSSLVYLADWILICREHMLRNRPAVQLHSIMQVMVAIKVTRVWRGTSFKLVIRPSLGVLIAFRNTSASYVQAVVRDHSAHNPSFIKRQSLTFSLLDHLQRLVSDHSVDCSLVPLTFNRQTWRNRHWAPSCHS